MRGLKPRVDLSQLASHLRSKLPYDFHSFCSLLFCSTFASGYDYLAMDAHNIVQRHRLKEVWVRRSFEVESQRSTLRRPVGRHTEILRCEVFRPPLFLQLVKAMISLFMTFFYLLDRVGYFGLSTPWPVEISK